MRSRLESVIDEVGEEELHNTVMRSIVGVGYLATHPHTGKRIYGHVSGFLISVEGTWFFITAGHVITDLEEGFKQGYTIDQWHIDDSGMASTEQQRIPFPFPFTRVDTVVMDDEAERDYAAIRIKSLFRDLLQKNGKAAMAEDQWSAEPWQNGPPFDVLAYCLVGVPSEQVSQTDPDDPFLIQKSVAFLEIIPMERPILQRGKTNELTLYGKIQEDLTDEKAGITLESIKGMSGGPFLAQGVGTDHTLKTAVVAVQSSWIKSERVVIGYKISSFGDFLRRHKAELEIGGAWIPNE